MPLLRGHLAQTGVAGDAGGVDQDVDAAVLLFDPFDQLSAAVEVADVDRLERDGAAEVGDLIVERGHALRARGQVQRDHLAPGAGQLTADFRAEAADAAGDQGEA